MHIVLWSKSFVSVAPKKVLKKWYDNAARGTLRRYFYHVTAFLAKNPTIRWFCLSTILYGDIVMK